MFNCGFGPEDFRNMASRNSDDASIPSGPIDNLPSEENSEPSVSGQDADKPFSVEQLMHASEFTDDPRMQAIKTVAGTDTIAATRLIQMRRAVEKGIYSDNLNNQ